MSQLFDMLLEIREQYGEILLKRWNVAFRYRSPRDEGDEGNVGVKPLFFSSACSSDLPLSRLKVMRAHRCKHTHTHTHTHQCGFVGNVPVLVLKFYKRPRERKCLKANVRNIFCPSEWVPLQDTVCVCVRVLTCHCFTIALVQ